MSRIIGKSIKSICALYKHGHLFEIAWAFFLFASIMTQTAWHGSNEAGAFASVLQGMRYFAYAVSMVQILLNVLYKKYTKESALFYLIFGLIAIINMFVTSFTGMFIHFIVFFAAYKANSRRLVLSATVLRSAILITLVMSSALGLSPDYVFDSTTRMRHSLGFYWTASAPHLFLFVSLQCIYLFKNVKARNFYIICIVLEIINVILYLLTDTRMPFLITTVFLLFCVLEKILHEKWNIFNYIKKIAPLIPISICIFSILFPLYNQNSMIWEFLNKVLSGRMYLGKNGIINYGLTLFGQKIEWIGLSITNPQMNEKYNYVDCSYIRILLDHGLLFLTVCIAIYTIIIYKARKNRDLYLLVTIFAILVLSMIDHRLIDMTFNIFPVLAFCGEDIFKEFRPLSFMARKLPFDKIECFNDRLRAKIKLKYLEG
jgi:hypothetical protein